MKKIKTEKPIFDDIHGLSCIENYFLYILAIQNYEYRYLYAKSFIPICDVVSAFCDESVSYAYFNKIPRLQNLANDEGLINLFVSDDLHNAVLCHDYICIKVTPEFSKERYKREFWRDDHYILLCEQKENGWICINDNPRDVFFIHNDEMPQIYAGQAIGLDINTELNTEQKESLLTEFYSVISKPLSESIFDINSLEIVRDILGIIRVTRKRICEYCSIYFNTDFMKDYLTQMDKYYSVIEYMRLRNKTNLRKVNQTFTDLQTLDFQIINTLNEKFRYVHIN